MKVPHSDVLMSDIAAAMAPPFYFKQRAQATLHQTGKDKVSIFPIPTGKHREALITSTEKWGSVCVYDTFITCILLCQSVLNMSFVWHYMPSRRPGGWSLTVLKMLLGKIKTTNPAKKT